MDNQAREHLQHLIQIHQKRLHILEQQAASFGLHVPPHILTEIEDIQEKIKSIKAQLHIVETPVIDNATIASGLDTEIYEDATFQKICLICYDFFAPVYGLIERTTDKAVLINSLHQHVRQTGELDKVKQLLLN